MKRFLYITSLVISILSACSRENDDGLIDLPGNTNNKPELVTSADTLFFYGNEVKELVIKTFPLTDMWYQIIYDYNAPWLLMANIDFEIKSSPDTVRLQTDFSNTPYGIYDTYIEIQSDLGSKLVYIRAVNGDTIPDSLQIAPFVNTKSISIYEY
jgi:hypothetical protein